MEILSKGIVSTEFQTIHPKLFRNCVCPQNLHTSQLGEITGFFAVLGIVYQNYFYSFFELLDDSSLKIRQEILKKLVIEIFELKFGNLPVTLKKVLN